MFVLHEVTVYTVVWAGCALPLPPSAGSQVTEPNLMKTNQAIKLVFIHFNSLVQRRGTQHKGSSLWARDETASLGGRSSLVKRKASLDLYTAQH